MRMNSIRRSNHRAGHDPRTSRLLEGVFCWPKARDLSSPAPVPKFAVCFTELRPEPGYCFHGIDAHQALPGRTREASREGVFETPFFILGEEPFRGWGRLRMVQEWLSLGANHRPMRHGH